MRLLGTCGSPGGRLSMTSRCDRGEVAFWFRPGTGVRIPRVTERKPPGVSFESWIDRQIRESRERGEFDDLPGTGKPLPGVDGPYDELWWVRQKLRRENVSVLPPSLALRKEAETARQAALDAGSEAEAREILAAVNRKIVEANTKSVGGPATNLAPFDTDRLLELWRAAHPDPRERDQPAPAVDLPPATNSWWRRILHRR